MGPVVMILGQNHLFLCIGAADRGAVAVVARGDPPGADTVNPGDIVGMPHVGGTQYFPFMGTCGAEEPLVVKAGDHIGKIVIMIFLLRPGIIGLDARRQNNRPDPDFHLLRLLTEIDGLGLADADADLAFPLL
ncbi:MAG: hypothetical protein A4E69_01836 [Syntrophus sp. PtaB.Bin138]|nr:MAG: hypothetical protein A4E69_01836 [Syntrophus sp. PtaB.Bin138]